MQIRPAATTSRRCIVLSLCRVATEVACLLAVASLASATDVTGALTFIGIEPCRMADTRGTGGFSLQAGPPSLIANASRTFQITGHVPGLPISCGIADSFTIPRNAAAIAVNFTVTGFSGAGDLRVFPAGGAPPLTSILNYSLENIANATTVALGPIGGREKGITVQCDASATDFVMDVLGYYVATPVEYDAAFTLNMAPQSFQCAQWNGFRGSLDPGTFTRITLTGSAGGPVISCDDSSSVAQIVGALVTGTSVSVQCSANGRTPGLSDRVWNVGTCNTGIEINNRSFGGPTGVCGCDGALTLRPCNGDANWGGVGYINCGAPSQIITLRLER
jgi:hypothetical protein